MDLENEDINETTKVEGPSKISRCATIMPTLEFKHHWDISQFSVHQELHSPGESLISSKFGDEEHEFVLKLFPAGKDEECSGHLSLFLQILKCPTPKLQFRVNFVIDTVDGPRGCPLNKNVVTINRGGIVTASKFFNIEQLKARSSRYVPNDTLRIITDLLVYGEPNSQAVDPFEGSILDSSNVAPSSASMSYNTADILKQCTLGGLLETGMHSDFEIIVEDQVIRVHKAILAARSSYFAGLLKPENKEFNEGRLTISDVPLHVMRALLEFMYTMKIPEVEDARELIYAADRFFVDSLKSQLMNNMSRTMTIENVFSRLEIGYRLNDERMFRKAAALFGRYKEALLTSEEFKSIMSQEPLFAAQILEKSWSETDRLKRGAGKRRRTSS